MRWPAARNRFTELSKRTGCIAHVLDVTDREVCARPREVEFDIFVNNAGVDRPNPFLKADAEDIDLLIDVKSARRPAPVPTHRAGNRNARPRTCRQYQLDRRCLQFRRQLHLSRDQSGRKHAVTRAAHRCVRPARPCNRDLPRKVATDIFAHVHGSSRTPTSGSSKATSCPRRTTSPTRSRSRSPPPSPSTSVTWRSPRPSRSLEGSRPPGLRISFETTMRGYRWAALILS